jgi:arginine/serine-rich splicing factor 4/5/6
MTILFQGERGRPRDESRSVANQRPTKTLFVINFDPKRTTVRDIERHFDGYGKILHVRIRRNFAFVQFETQEDATKALECTHMRLVVWFFIALLGYLPLDITYLQN